MPAARRAGTQQATALTRRNNTVIVVNVARSVGLMPMSMLLMILVSPTDPVRPIAMPITPRVSPCAIRSLTTRAGSAPKAIRRAISAVRCRTALDTTPYNPTVASKAAMTANIPMSEQIKTSTRLFSLNRGVHGLDIGNRQPSRRELRNLGTYQRGHISVGLPSVPNTQCRDIPIAQKPSVTKICSRPGSAKECSR